MIPKTFLGLATILVALASASNAAVIMDDFTTDGSGADVFGRSFTPTSLAVGETIRLTLDYKETSAGSIVRFGLYQTENSVSADGFNSSGASAVGTYAGYYTFLRDASASTSVARFETDSSDYVEEFGLSIGSASVNFDRIENTQYSVVFDVTRTSLTSVNTLINFNSADGNTTHMSVAGVHNSATNTQSSFNGVFIRLGGANAVIDNVTVSVIPEPGTMAFSGAFAALALLRRRRG